MTLLACAALLAAAAPVLPDEGYDFCVLDLPHRAVLGSALKFTVRARPTVPYVVYGDVGRRLTILRRVWVHLDLGPALFLAAGGRMPGSGGVQHQLAIPNDPALHDVTLHFQAFVSDASILDGLGASDGKQVTFHREEQQPLISLLTVNKIPRDLNGAEINEGVLYVPPTGFTIDVFFDERGRGAIDPASLVVAADQALGGGAIPPNTNLAPRFSFAGSSASAIVDSSWAFPLGNVTLRAEVKNLGGARSPVESYTVNAAQFQVWSQPFQTKQIWLVDFDAHDAGRNLIPDFREDLLLYGLGSSATETAGPSFEVQRWCRAESVRLLRQHYGLGGPDPVNVDFVTSPPTGVHAKICVGGRNPYPVNMLPPGARETTGAAYANRNNRIKDYVICHGVLGVHPGSIFHLWKDVPAFQAVFGPLQQNPVGNDADDAIVTAPGFDPARATTRQRLRFYEIVAGVRAYASATSFILVQETGHAMGMTASGRLNTGGLLGGYTNGHSTDWHHDDGQGSFMSGNNSTPAPAELPNLSLIWDHMQSGRGHFSALEWAYLRERMINQ
jgi:hypothetical protein